MKTYGLVAFLIIAAFLVFLILKSPKEQEGQSSQTAEKSQTAPKKEIENLLTPEQKKIREIGVKKPEDYTLEDIEKIEGIGKLTKEEREAKPSNVSWQHWAFSVATHRNEMNKNGTIEFYGKVIDEEGNPIEGATLTIQVLSYSGSIAKKIENGRSSEIKKIPVKTDQNGDFRIKGEKGADIVLRDYKKEGYQLAGKKKGWSFSFMPNDRESHKADPTNPVEFVMRRID